MKVFGEGSSLMRSSATKPPNEDGRASPAPEANRKRLLQEKLDDRKQNLPLIQCQSKCFFLFSPDLHDIYIPNSEQNQ